MAMKNLFIILSLFILFNLFFVSIDCESIDTKELKCLVCKKLIEEMTKEIDKVDPKKTIEIGAYHFDERGGKRRKVVEYRKSEVYLTELMERICSRMEDYVRARKKTNGQLVVLPLVGEGGKMSPDIAHVDIIQDSDLNRSLKYYCEGILDEFEEQFVASFSKDQDNLDIILCSDVAGFCNDTIDTEYQFEANEEL